MRRQKRRQDAEKAAGRLRKEVVHKMLQKHAFKVVFGGEGCGWMDEWVSGKMEIGEGCGWMDG